MATSRTEIEDFLAGSLNVDRAAVSTENLFSSGLLDSLAMLQLIGFLEKSSGIRIRAEDVTLENFDTVAGIMRYLESNS
jgi:acyl carrier protein